MKKEMDMYLIGRRIRKRREELELSQDTLAKRMGYAHRSSVSKIENGERDFPVSVLCKFAQVLGVSLTALVGGEQ